MKKLTFEGHSDDTFACTGPGIDVDCDNCFSQEPTYMRVEKDGAALVVFGQYAPGPCAGWVIGIAPADFGVDEYHIAPWPIRLERSEREYSPRLIIEAPDGVTVKLIDP